MQDDLALGIVGEAVSLEYLTVVEVLEAGDMDLFGALGQILFHHLNVRGRRSLLAPDVGQLVERQLAQDEEQQLRVVLLVGEVLLERLHNPSHLVLEPHLH